MPELVQAVKRGVLEAGGLRLVFPTSSLAEILLEFPTLDAIPATCWRWRPRKMSPRQPMDAVYCSAAATRPFPHRLMAAASANSAGALCVRATGPD